MRDDLLELRGATEIAGHPPVAWALEGLSDAVENDARLTELAVVFVSRGDVVHSAGSGLPSVPEKPESYAAVVSEEAGELVVRLSAPDDRGFMYAIAELAARIRAYGRDGIVGWQEAETPAVPVRAIQRNFSSVLEDLPWFHDREFWVSYLDHLASQRFNRFHLAFGMQYNYGTGWESRTASDNYLVFTYPFLLDVPGFDVFAVGVSEEERNRNLQSLAFIARETRRRGMSFQLGLWNHAYDFGHESKEWYPIRGVNAENHSDYSAAALGMLLRTIPEIDGVTFRVHHEGGVHEGGREVFWGKLFQAASAVGRPLEIDMHAKGADETLVRAATKPNLRPVISAKHLAEHMGLAYHQASIRPREQTPLRFEGQDVSVTGLTDGARRFTRYGYADYLSEDRCSDVMFRMWPGTQKLLLWGDPALSAGYGRFSTIGGSRGLEFCEPLTFKGRRGSGAEGKRDPYARDDFRLGVHDWQKYRYTYVLWGRLMYNPDADPEVWRRHLRAEFGNDAAPHLEEALAVLSRALPLVAHVHGVSAANNFYSPELYVDMPISSRVPCMHYAWDTTEPRIWEGVSTFDPTLFYNVGEYVDAVAGKTLDARYTPLEVAAWLSAMAERGDAALALVSASPTADSSTVERALIDLRIVVHLSRFFADKFRAAIDYAFYRRTGHPAALDRSINYLSSAHQHYADVAATADGVYNDDIAFGVGLSDRGAWADRLESMQVDMAALRAEREEIDVDATPTVEESAYSRDSRWTSTAVLECAEEFERGKSLRVVLSGDMSLTNARLHFRHLNQGEEWRELDMAKIDEGFVAEIPGSYTACPYPLTFFASVGRGDDHPVFVPALSATLSNQPYLIRYSSAMPEHLRPSTR